MKQISRMKSRMGFHPGRGCGIVMVAKRTVRSEVVTLCHQMAGGRVAHAAYRSWGMTDRMA